MGLQEVSFILLLHGGLSVGLGLLSLLLRRMVVFRRLPRLQWGLGLIWGRDALILGIVLTLSGMVTLTVGSCFRDREALMGAAFVFAVGQMWLVQLWVDDGGRMMDG